MREINLSAAKPSNILRSELSAIGGLKVRNHLDETLTSQVRHFEDAINYILTYSADEESLFDSIIGVAGSKKVEAFDNFASSCTNYFSLNLAREQVWFIFIKYFKEVMAVELNKVVEINSANSSEACTAELMKISMNETISNFKKNYMNILNPDKLNLWFESSHGRRLDLNPDVMGYINEIKISEDEIKFDFEPYNLEQANVHIKLAKFSDESWKEASFVRANKYIGSDTLLHTSKTFPQCERIQYLFALDKIEMVNKNNTSFDRREARKHMLETRVVRNDLQRTISDEYNTCCETQFQQRFENILKRDDNLLYEPFEVSGRWYFKTLKVINRCNDMIPFAIGLNFNEILAGIKECVYFLLDNPRLDYLYVDSGNYHHAIALIFSPVGNLVKVWIHDPASKRLYIKLYLDPQKLNDSDYKNRIISYLSYVQFFHALANDKTSIHLVNLTYRVPKALLDKVDKKRINNTLNSVLCELKRHLPLYTTQLIMFILLTRDQDLAKKVFPIKNLTVTNLENEHWTFKGNNLIGVFVLYNVYELTKILLDSWNTNYIAENLSNQVRNGPLPDKNPVDSAVYLDNIPTAELLIKHGGKPSEIFKDGAMLPELMKLNPETLNGLIMNNHEKLLELTKPRLNVQLPKENNNVNSIMENFFKLQFFNKFTKASQTIGASAS